MFIEFIGFLEFIESRKPHWAESFILFTDNNSINTTNTTNTINTMRVSGVLRAINRRHLMVYNLNP